MLLVCCLYCCTQRAMSLLTEAARLEGNTAVFVIVTDDMVA